MLEKKRYLYLKTEPQSGLRSELGKYLQDFKVQFFPSKFK